MCNIIACSLCLTHTPLEPRIGGATSTDLFVFIPPLTDHDVLDADPVPKLLLVNDVLPVQNVALVFRQTIQRVLVYCAGSVVLRQRSIRSRAREREGS